MNDKYRHSITVDFLFIKSFEDFKWDKYLETEGVLY